jgi:hypothetical protein
MNDKPRVDEKKSEIEPKTDEKVGFYFSSSIKITDPETKEVLLQIRGDN